MENQLFNLKFAAKNTERRAKTCEKNEKDEKQKTKVALQKGNMEGARIHAENAIRNKNQALMFHKMSARIDAVCNRVQTAISIKATTSSMANVVKLMESASKAMNLEQLSNLMDRFESTFENLDVQSQVMDNTMVNTTTLMTPEEHVNNLMKETADAAGIELSMDLPGTATGVVTSQVQEEDLSKRLAQLRQT